MTEKPSEDVERDLPEEQAGTPATETGTKIPPADRHSVEWGEQDS
jgi:hypothetical protein